MTEIKLDCAVRRAGGTRIPNQRRGSMELALFESEIFLLSELSGILVSIASSSVAEVGPLGFSSAGVLVASIDEMDNGCAGENIEIVLY